MCSIIVLNHGHQWGWVEQVYCCCSAGLTDKASLLKMVELLQYFGTNTEVLCLLFANEVARGSLYFLRFSLSSPSFPGQGSHIWSYSRFLPVFFSFDSLFGDQPLGFWKPLRDSLDCNRSYIVYSWNLFISVEISLRSEHNGNTVYSNAIHSVPQVSMTYLACVQTGREWDVLC